MPPRRPGDEGDLLAATAAGPAPAVSPVEGVRCDESGAGPLTRRVGWFICAVLHRQYHLLFADELFADLFSSTGRRSVPPQIVATVMALQRGFGLSHREAVDVRRHAQSRSPRCLGDRGRIGCGRA